jgi:hypothetical protein
MMHRPFCRVVLCAVGALVIVARGASAQTAFPPTTVVNLRVLRADTPPREVIAAMRDMTLALGVRCQHCHVGVEGQPLDRFDFVADTVPAKATARAMLRLTRDINTQLRAALPGAPEVTCYTCHRGATAPLHAAPSKPVP